MADGNVGRNKPPGWKRPLPHDAEQQAASWVPDGLEVELIDQNGRLVDPRGGNPPVFPSGHTCKDADDDEQGGGWLPDPDRTWAETIASKYKHRPANELPKLPPWATLRFRAFLETSRLRPDQILKFLRSPDQAARKLAEHAEQLASGYTLEGEQKPREMQADRAQLLLRGVLEIADEIRGLLRHERERVNVRRRDHSERDRKAREKNEPPSPHRTEMLSMYAEILKQLDWRALPPRERELREEVAEHFESVSRPAAPQSTRGGARCGWYLWDPPEIDTTKNKAITEGCHETPSLQCAHIDRGPHFSERRDSL